MAININKIIKIFCIIITILIIIILSRGCDVIARIELNGNEEITLYQNSPFTDPGYNIIDDNGDYYVKVDSNINTNNVGIYQINYSLYDKDDKYISTVTRKIIVKEDKNTDINMYLKGDEEEYFFLNEYVDHGIEVYNGNIDITSDVNVISNVKPNVIGRYEVKYQIYIGNDIKEVIRKVNIIDYDIKEEINLNDYEKLCYDNVKLNLEIYGIFSECSDEYSLCTDKYESFHETIVKNTNLKMIYEEFIDISQSERLSVFNGGSFSFENPTDCVVDYMIVVLDEDGSPIADARGEVGRGTIVLSDLNIPNNAEANKMIIVVAIKSED